jgi:2-keto-4-pentenoate hydratase
MADMGSTDLISAALVNARREGAVLAEFPGQHPADLREAYRIQDQAIALTGRTVGGWKVGRIAASLIAKYGAERIGGPIFVDQISYAADGQPVEMSILRGFAAVEAEILLKVGATPDRELTLDTAVDFVSEVRLGIEIASSPFPGINEHGPAVTASDFGNNFGLVVGPLIEDWRMIDLLHMPTKLEIEDELQGEGILANMLDGPFGSFAFLSNMLAHRGLALKEGDWVSTGAITGVHQIEAGKHARAVFADRYTVDCRTIAYVGSSNGKAIS